MSDKERLRRTERQIGSIRTDVLREEREEREEREQEAYEAKFDAYYERGGQSMADDVWRRIKEER